MLRNSFPATGQMCCWHCERRCAVYIPCAAVGKWVGWVQFTRANHNSQLSVISLTLILRTTSEHLSVYCNISRQCFFQSLLFWTLFSCQSPSKVTAPMTFILQIKLFFAPRWLMDLIISAKVQALSKYPGAIATALTKVNEIYGGFCFTFESCGIFARLWRGNKNNITQHTHPHLISYM